MNTYIELNGLRIWCDLKMFYLLKTYRKLAGPSTFSCFWPFGLPKSKLCLAGIRLLCILIARCHLGLRDPVAIYMAWEHGPSRLTWRGNAGLLNFWRQRIFSSAQAPLGYVKWQSGCAGGCVTLWISPLLRNIFPHMFHLWIIRGMFQVARYKK